jgi:hypothetical protein
MLTTERLLRLVAVGLVTLLVVGPTARLVGGSDQEPDGGRRVVYLVLCGITFLSIVSLIVLFSLYAIVGFREYSARARSALVDDLSQRAFPVVDVRPNGSQIGITTDDSAQQSIQYPRHDYPGVTVIPQYSPPIDGPGRYRIQGVSEASKEDVAIDVEADSQANAKVKAELDGIVVTAIEKISEKGAPSLDQTIEFESDIS